MSSLVKWEKIGRVAIVTITNPPMNVMSQGVAEMLLDIFVMLDQAEDIGAIILCGEGDRAFMAGADIKEFPQALGQPGLAFATSMRLHKLMNVIEQCPKPVIAAMRGIVFGGGLELALACDMRICEEGTKMGLPEINLGIFPGAGGTQRLPRLIGSARAKEMMYTGVPVSAESAERMGLVNRVTPQGQSLTVSLELAQEIASKSAPALARIKQAVDRGGEQPLSQATLYEASLFDEVFQTADSREGIEAFIAKRTPRFIHQ